MSDKIVNAQNQVDQVVDIMKTNVEKVIERDQKLSELDDRVNALQQGALQFKQNSVKLKKKYWFKNIKSLAIITVVVVIFILLLVFLFKN